MNKRAARILILFLVFAASVGVFTHLMSHETTENATDLDAASLPVLYMKTADMTVNRMYGYRQEMNGVTTRENLTPLPMDRSLTLEIDAKEMILGAYLESSFLGSGRTSSILPRMNFLPSFACLIAVRKMFSSMPLILISI